MSGQSNHEEEGPKALVHILSKTPTLQELFPPCILGSLEQEGIALTDIGFGGKLHELGFESDGPGMIIRDMLVQLAVDSSEREERFRVQRCCDVSERL